MVSKPWSAFLKFAAPSRARPAENAGSADRSCKLRAVAESTSTPTILTPADVGAVRDGAIYLERETIAAECELPVAYYGKRWRP